MIKPDKSPLTLVLFTFTFPYGTGEPFLETEIPYLAARFRRVIIVPSQTPGRLRSVPPGVSVVTTFSKSRDKGLAGILRMGMSCLRSKLFYQELFSRPSSLVQPKALSRLIIYLAHILDRQQWLKSFMASSDIDPHTTVFYSYWLMPQALSISLAKANYPAIRTVTRAHGSDLYEYAHTPAYLPFWKQALQEVDYIFLISENGRNYVLQKEPAAASRCFASRLGVVDPGFINSPSNDAVFRVVSCSNLLPVKRLQLLIDGLALFARCHPQQKIEWHHLGSGPLQTALEKYAGSQLPSNAWCNFHGQISNKQVFEFYKRQQLDVFMNVSASEGIPVSIMEAQSCGIPVIATDVGGVSEIVNPENGVLLNGNPSPREIASALEIFLENPQNALQKRIASRENWEVQYNAEKNYSAFIDHILTLYFQS